MFKSCFLLINNKRESKAKEKSKLFPPQLKLKQNLFTFFFLRSNSDDLGEMQYQRETNQPNAQDEKIEEKKEMKSFMSKLTIINTSDSTTILRLTLSIDDFLFFWDF